MLPRGTRITVVATFDDVLLPPGAAPLVAKRPDAVLAPRDVERRERR